MLNQYVVDLLMVLFPMINCRDPATRLSFSDLEFISYSFLFFFFKLFISVADLKNHLGNLHCSIEIVFLQDPQTP